MCMKKIVLNLLLVGCGLTLCACDNGPSSEELERAKVQQAQAELEARTADTKKLADELNAIAPEDFGIGMRAPLTVGSDGNGIVFRVAMKQKMFDETNAEQLESFQKGFKSQVQAVFCEGQNVAKPMKKYMTQGHYLDFSLASNEGKTLFAEKMDEIYCKSNQAVVGNLTPEQLTMLTEKQKTQGYYDDEYLNQVIIANYQKQLPQPMTSELSVVSLSATNGELTYHVDYKPTSGKPNAAMIKALLKSIPENTCELAPVQTLLHNVKSMVYSVEIDGKSLETITMTKDSCKAILNE